jgi:hypothetical protein
MHGRWPGVLEFSVLVESNERRPVVTAADLVIANLIDSAPASVGFAFANIPMTAGRTQTSDVTVSYTVASVSGSAVITGAGLVEVGQGIPDTGFATIAEALCTAGSASPCPSGSSFNLGTSFNSTLAQKPADSIGFSGTGAIAVTDQLHAAGGIIGSGAISGFSNTFADAPEPATFTLIGFGLLLFFPFRRAISRSCRL